MTVACKMRRALFPFLFTLYIEPLAQWLRQAENIKGICINGEYKVVLYANYILICLSDPSNSFPDLMNFLETFGRYAGYKLNYKKLRF